MGTGIQGSRAVLLAVLCPLGPLPRGLHVYIVHRLQGAGRVKGDPLSVSKGQGSGQQGHTMTGSGASGRWPNGLSPHWGGLRSPAGLRWGLWWVSGSMPRGRGLAWGEGSVCAVLSILLSGEPPPTLYLSSPLPGPLLAAGPPHCGVPSPLYLLTCPPLSFVLRPGGTPLHLRQVPVTPPCLRVSPLTWSQNEGFPPMLWSQGHRFRPCSGVLREEGLCPPQSPRPPRLREHITWS